MERPRRSGFLARNPGRCLRRSSKLSSSRQPPSVRRSEPRGRPEGPRVADAVIKAEIPHLQHDWSTKVGAGGKDVMARFVQNEINTCETPALFLPSCASGVLCCVRGRGECDSMPISGKLNIGFSHLMKSINETYRGFVIHAYPKLVRLHRQLQE